MNFVTLAIKCHFFFKIKFLRRFLKMSIFWKKNCWAPLNSWGKQRRPPPCTCHLPPCTASQKEAPNTMSRLCLETCAWSLTGQIINDRCDPMSFSLHWNPFNLQGMEKVREICTTIGALLLLRTCVLLLKCFFAVHICL